MAQLKINHCELPIKCPAECTFVREVPAVDNDGGLFVELCTYADNCPFKSAIVHTVQEEILE